MTFSKTSDPRIDFDRIRSVDEETGETGDDESGECSDLIRKFVLEDDESDDIGDFEDGDQIKVQVHFQPVTRVIPGGVGVMTSGSQTDITALKEKSVKLRSWVSEPILDEFDGIKYKRKLTGDHSRVMMIDTGDWTTAVLLAEAEEFVRLGRSKFVTLSDWIDIKRNASYKIANNKKYT